MKKKISKIKKLVAELGLDALFISNKANITYLTGFAGLSPYQREAFVLISKNSSFLLAFSTCFGMYKNNKNFKAVNIPSQIDFTSWLTNFLCQNKLKNVGFEKADITVAELNKLKKVSKKITFKETEKIVENLRLLKNEKEITSIKKGCRITDRAFLYLLPKIKLGDTEKQIALRLEYFIKRHADDIAFSPVVAFNQNAAIPHYLPSKTFRLKANSLILLDFGAKVNNYCSDMTRVIFFGKPDKKFVKLYNTVLKAQELALKQLTPTGSNTPGVTRRGSPGVKIKASTIDKAVKDFIFSKGFSPYPHGLGHGVGIQVHETPRLKLTSSDILSPNMVFTIEPAIYLEDWGGVRIEDLVVLRKNGPEILSKSPKNIVML